jgi:apolipoprotein N-acyltransferase
LFSQFSENHVVVLGANNIDYSEGKKKIYNSLIVVDRDANLIASYNKNKLVPFGEFLPFEKYFHKLGIKKITAGYESFTKGKSRELINLGEEFENIKFLPLICYEIIYSGKIKSKNQKPDFIINISEDAWFGNSIGPYQHFSKAVYRAVEERTYIFRSANKGISGVIDSRGNLIASIDLNEVNKIVVNSPKFINESFFNKFGNKIYFLIILLYTMSFFLFKKTYE